jgi:hypothetical protein
MSEMSKLNEVISRFEKVLSVGQKEEALRNHPPGQAPSHFARLAWNIEIETPRDPEKTASVSQIHP